MTRKNWITLTIRMPKELHEVIKFISRTLRMSINQLMIETLAGNMDMWYSIQTPGEIGYPFTEEDWDQVQKALEIASKKITESVISDYTPDIEALKRLQDEES